MKISGDKVGGHKSIDVKVQGRPQLNEFNSQNQTPISKLINFWPSILSAFDLWPGTLSQNSFILFKT